MRGWPRGGGGSFGRPPAIRRGLGAGAPAPPEAEPPADDVPKTAPRGSMFGSLLARPLLSEPPLEKSTSARDSMATVWRLKFADGRFIQDQGAPSCIYNGDFCAMIPDLQLRLGQTRESNM